MYVLEGVIESLDTALLSGCFGLEDVGVEAAQNPMAMNGQRGRPHSQCSKAFCAINTSHVMSLPCLCSPGEGRSTP